MVTTPPRILIADDQPDVLNALRLLLKGQGYETEGVASPAEMLRALGGLGFYKISRVFIFRGNPNAAR